MFKKDGAAFLTSEECQGDIGTVTTSIDDGLTLDLSMGDTQLARLRCTMNETMQQLDDMTIRCGGTTMSMQQLDDTTIRCGGTSMSKNWPSFINQNGNTWFIREIRDSDAALLPTSD
jgi:hypothetical protein